MKWRYWSLLGLALLSVGSWAECELKVGVVPQFEQRKLLETWQPILAELETRLHCQLQLVGSEGIPDFEEGFAAGAYDIAYMNPYHALVAYDTQGYIPVLRSGSAMLQGVLVVRNDSDITSLEQLDGRVVAFPSPNALGASLLMRAELKGRFGIDIVPRYVKTHPSVYLHVIKGLAAAGGGVQRTLSEQPDDIQARLKTIYKTRQVPAHPLVVHPRLGQAMRLNIQQALLALAAERPELFAEIPMRDPIASSVADYDGVRELHLENFQD
ncbi:phosphate/phosphite/phosphonate ABC transporter substrate-binding protein [Oceanobacter mangrovi]|uniref:phosphate/phosphite/phosphonate ABC transporter substrate-binding protein n=1 Tax=Oceanobacter mangrovi TaxID=2862510 RepID=UPI001C8D3F79|nr:phosphate/phosphite/phosphonate ABC transporter substrate-binding protein [Oceanobacter mangrovi]